MLVDLHTHSTASDGQYSPTELVRMAKEKEIQLLALTDHDTIGGIKEAREAAAFYEVPFVPGHPYAEKKYYEKLAREYQMIQTAGSDFHGEKVKPSVKLGVKRELQDIPIRYMCI